MNNYWQNLIQSPTFNPNDIQRQIAKEKAKRSLTEFMRQAWPIIEPAVPLQMNWHIELIAEYLEAVKKRDITRLIVNVPPRTLKSIEITVCYPIWNWIEEAYKRFIKVSYSDSLSRKHNILSRNIINSSWYQENWGEEIKLKDDVNRQNEFENSKSGSIYSTSTGGTLTGAGGDEIILDDPQDPAQANSETERTATISFFTNTLQTRLNDPNKGAIIVVMQRLHEKDLTGHILAEQLGYEHLCLPMEAPKKTIIVFPKSGREITRQEGDLLIPQRYSKESLKALAKSMGTAQYAGQFNQTPSPADGIIFKKAYLEKRYKTLPQGVTIIQSWDQPFTKSEGSAKCAGVVLGRKGADIFIIDLENEKMEFTESVAAMRAMTLKHPKARAKVVENKANGPAIVSLLKKEIPGLVEFNPKGSKEERAISVTPYFEAGNVYLPDTEYIRADWVKEFIDELVKFPRGEFKDVVDATVQGILYLMDKPISSGSVGTAATSSGESYWRR